VRLETRRATLVIGGGVLAVLGTNAWLGSVDAAWARRVASLLGVAFLLGLALLFSRSRSRIPVRTVVAGLALQLVLGLLVLRTPIGSALFGWVGGVFDVIFQSAAAGAGMVFGDLSKPLPIPPFSPAGCVVLAITLVSILVLMGSLSRMLYYLGVLQWLVRWMAWLMRRLMRASGAESLAAAANVFVGMVEAPLTVRPYVAAMTRSELFCVMTAGMATVAGTVMAFYASILEQSGVLPDAAGHLLTASVMSAPAAILIAKTLLPETERSATADADVVPAIDEGDDAPVNLMDAAAQGGLEGVRLGINVTGMLIAFVALVHMLNLLLGAGVGLVSDGTLTFQGLVGWACAPLAVGMGLPLGDAVAAGQLIGTKTVLNELLAYQELGKMAGQLSPHGARVMSYALCGFANFGSVAIMLAGLGGIAPSRRKDLARLGLPSLAGGALAGFLTACMAGLLG